MNLANESEFLLRLKTHRERIITEMKNSHEFAKSFIESKALVLTINLELTK